MKKSINTNFFQCEVPLKDSFDLEILSSNTKIRRLGYLKLLLKYFNENGRVPISKTNLDFERYCQSYNEYLSLYKNRKGNIIITKTGNSAAPYIELGISLGLIHKSMGYYELGKIGKVYCVLRKNLRESNGENPFVLSSFEQSFFLDSMTARERLENIIYRASFVVVEDSVTGYKQANYYEQTPDEPFFGWESLPNPTDIVYNDVARGIYSSYEGEPCLPETLEAETTYEYSYTFAVPTNIQRKQNLRVVGLLTDPQTGYIVNADQTTPQKENGSSIISLNEPTPIAKVYLEENNIVIRLNKENPEKVQIALYTSQGVLIHQSTTSSDCLIPVNELKGVHFVRIQTEGRIQTEKILL